MYIEIDTNLCRICAFAIIFCPTRHFIAWIYPVLHRLKGLSMSVFLSGKKINHGSYRAVPR